MQRRYVNFFSRMTRVAAVLFIPILISSLFYITKQISQSRQSGRIAYTEIYTPLAAKTRFMLPDSTIVWLNSSSKLKFPSEFSGNRREVFITGEGYFEVKENANAPFIVRTTNMDITALGTAFNVTAYPDDMFVMTTLVNGKVKVDNKSAGTSVTLNPSEQIVLDINSKKMQVSAVDTRYYTSWKEGNLIFRNEPLGDVARKLERWFNCTVHIQDDKLRDFRYTGNIEMETLREVLELISITTPIQSTYKPETREIWLEMKN